MTFDEYVTLTSIPIFIENKRNVLLFSDTSVTLIMKKVIQMNQSYSTIERMLETSDGCISRKAAIANGVAPASFARYFRSHGLIKIRRGVYTKEIGVIDDLFQLQIRYPKIVYSGITALYLLGLTDRIPESVEFSIPKGSRVRKTNNYSDYFGGKISNTFMCAYFVSK